MRVFAFVSVLIVALSLVAATAAPAEQCYICGRVMSDQAAAAEKPDTCGLVAASCPPVVTVSTTMVAPPPLPAPAPVAVAPQPYCPPDQAYRTANNCNAALFNQLRFENRQAGSILNRLMGAQPCQAADLYAQLRAQLVSHIKAEQNTLYPVLINDPASRKWVIMNGEVQQALLTQICALDQTAANDDLWNMRLGTLRELFARSVFIDEHKLWPTAHPSLSEAQCLALCQAHASEKMAVLANLPAYQMVASTTYFPANCFAGRTVTTSMQQQGPVNQSNVPSSSNTPSNMNNSNSNSNAPANNQ